MKRIYFFDVDNTIFSNKLQKVLPNTEKLLKHLHENDDNIVCYATGRGPAKMGILNDYAHYFTYGITVNGAIITKNKKVIFDFPINTDDIEEIIKDTKKLKISVGMVGFNKEAVTLFDKHVSYAMKGYTSLLPLVDMNFYKTNKVYQLWLFNENQDTLMDLASKYDKFQAFRWHYGGVDLIYRNISKENAIKLIIKNHPEYQVICVGDGHNDIEMIKLADIGIAMSNSKFDDLKNNATLIAPDILEDKLFDFFKENNLV